MQHTSDALRAWFRNVQPLCAELFNAAHVMCGNYDLAEYALRSAILDVWLQGASGGMGFRERLRGALRQGGLRGGAVRRGPGGGVHLAGRGQARAELNRFEARCRRRLPAQDRARAEALIARQAKRLLARNSPDAPQPGQVYRAFEAEAGAAQTTGFRLWRFAGGLLLALMALLCAGAFWLFAVLVQPV